jgi:S1-C subfamily serine protease
MIFAPQNRTPLALAIALLIAAPRSAPADQPPTTRPALAELDREIHALYDDAQSGLLRVQLPQPRWANEYALEPINKYQQLDPAVKLKIAQQAEQSTQTFVHIGRDGSYIITSRTESNPAPPDAASQPSATQPTLILVQPTGPSQQPPPQEAPGGQLEMIGHAANEFAPTHVGVVLDEQGDVLVPIYVEPETCQAQPIRLAASNGQIIEAKFIGSDRQTNLSVVQVNGAGGKPLQLGDRPETGSVCLFVSPIDGSAALGVWTGGPHDWGYVFSTDGQLVGIARCGQIISGSSCRLIADEILHYGAVRRPTLGVVVRELIQIDPQNGQKSVMRVEAVLAGSPADQAGIKPGDLLQSVNGQPISDVTTLAASMTACSGPTPIQVLRADQSLALTAQLELVGKK